MNFFKNLTEVLSKMKYNSRPYLVCPKCGSHKIFTSSWLDGWITPEKYICGKCGYTGFILMEIDKKGTTNQEKF